jgi:RNA recognition motif-containing protein
MKLYVGNLPFNSTQTDLQDLFERFGTVVETHLISDRETGRSRGFGFVTMGTKAEGEAAIAGLHGKQFAGRALTVNEARPREDRDKRSFSHSRR